ncbi:MAG: nucleotidyltransferase family protein [Syntrophobacterales bacterium]|nr:MAG: nucleotidyltransferase family protein [Syntrophobacterales bacterium]
MISAILLAAGASNRMGRPKLLLKWGRCTIIEKSVDTLLASKIDELIVVLGYQAQAILRSLGSRMLKAVINHQYRMGMSTSIRRGLGEVNSKSEAILIALADKPFIETDLIDHLIEIYRQNPHGIVLPSYRGTRGHPVILNSSRYQEEMGKLMGDVGCRSILKRHPEDILEVEVDSEGVITDINSWGEYITSGILKDRFQDNDAK